MTADGTARTRSASPQGPAIGCVHGFAVRSSEEFLYLRQGTGDPLHVVEDGTTPTDPGERLARIESRTGIETLVYRRGTEFAVRMENIGWFRVDVETSGIAVPPTRYPEWLEGIVWGLPVALLVLARGGLFVHASAVEIDGRVAILTGPTHHGKTTLAAALHAAGHRLLSEDLLRCGGDGPPVAYPGPAMLRLRKDVARWMSVPGGRRVTEDPEKVHFALDPRTRGTGEPLPIGGIFLLYRGDARALEPADLESVIPDLWAVTLNLPTAAGRAQCFGHIAEIAQTTPVWRMTRPLTRDALDWAVENVLETVRAAPAAPRREAAGPL